MSPTPMAKADFVSALVFFVLGLYMIEEGLGMPGAGGFIEEGGEPGRVPVLLGAIVALFALILLVRSVYRRGHRLMDGDGAGAMNHSGYIRSAITAVGCSVYAVGLVGTTIAGWQVPYEFATAVFLFLFIIGFEWDTAPEIGAARWAWVQVKWPAVARALAAVPSSLRGARAPYAWLTFTALVQAVLVTWAVSYLFEQEFYVLLP